MSRSISDTDRFFDFIAGFVTGEGSFYVTVQRSQSRWPQVSCGFSVKVRADDETLIRSIWRALDYAGNIHHIASRRYRYEWDTVTRHDSILLLVRNLDDLNRIIIPFFDRHGLRGRKRENYELWKQAVRLVECGEHLTPDGLEKIAAIRAELNRYHGQDEPDESATGSE